MSDVDRTGKITQTRLPFSSKLFQKHDCVISPRTKTAAKNKLRKDGKMNMPREWNKKKFPAGIEPMTFRTLIGCSNYRDTPRYCTGKLYIRTEVNDGREENGLKLRVSRGEGLCSPVPIKNLLVFPFSLCYSEIATCFTTVRTLQPSN